MKKLFFGMLAAGMLFTTSCSSEIDAPASGDEAFVTFEVALDGANATRAISDGLKNTTLVMAVYDADGNEMTEIRSTNDAAFNGGLTEKVSVKLVKGQTYSFAFWAQNGSCTAYNYGDLKNITVNYEGMLSNDESRDAFFGQVIEHKVTGDFTQDVILKRPFAQINLGVDDFDDAVASGVNVAQAKVIVSDVATSFNALTGAVEGQVTDLEIGLADIIHDAETLMVDLDGDGAKEAYAWLAMNYVLVNDATTGYESANADVEFTLANNREDIAIYASNVTLQRNWRTNIIGHLTNAGTFNVIVDPIYVNDHNQGEDANKPEDGGEIEGESEAVKALREVCANGGELTLSEDLDVKAPVVVAAGKSVVLNLNEKYITNTTDIWNADSKAWSLISVEGELTINAMYGRGGLFAKENDCFAIDVKNGGKLTINGGSYWGNVSAVYVMKGEAIINGGEFGIMQLDPAAGYGLTINCLDENYKNGTAKVSVTGGNFHKFDPANNAAEGAGTNFVAAGYASVPNGDGYSVELGQSHAPLYITGEGFANAWDPVNPDVMAYDAVNNVYTYKLNASNDRFKISTTKGTSYEDGNTGWNGFNEGAYSTEGSVTTEPIELLGYENGDIYVASPGDWTLTVDLNNMKIWVVGNGSTEPEQPAEPQTYTADFDKMGEANHSYLNLTSASGWVAKNCALQRGPAVGEGTSNAIQAFLGDENTYAVCLNGKTTAVGTLTSPVLNGKLQNISFNYGYAFADKNSTLTVNVKQNGNVVATKDFTVTSAKGDVNRFAWDVNVEGEFVIELVNQCSTGSTGNKDRVSIWNLNWTM